MWSEISKRGARHKATNTKLLCLPQFNLLLNACQSLQWNTMENIKKKKEKKMRKLSITIRFILYLETHKS